MSVCKNCGKPTINQEQAIVVELIYRIFLDGKTSRGIAIELEKRNIPAPAGGKKWTKSTIDSILTNEKYKGDALLQKTFTTDFLEKTKKVNTGEIPQYYVEGSHEAIIDPDIWTLVQSEIARRKLLGSSYSGKSNLSSNLVCEECGAFYGRKVWHSNDIYKKEIWQCNGKFKNDKHCSTPTLSTNEIHQMFIQAYNQQMSDLSRIISDCKLIQKTLIDFTELDNAIEQKTQESKIIAEIVKELIKSNASTILSQDEYIKKYENLSNRYDVITDELEKLQSEKILREQEDKAIDLYIRTLKKSPQVLTEWNDTIWTIMVEKAIVHKDKSLTFVFYNDNKTTVKL